MTRSRNGLLSKEMIRQGGRPPVVVGGEAVEIYTQGSYTTGDMDIKADYSKFSKIVAQWGFRPISGEYRKSCKIDKKRHGAERAWCSKEMDIYIDWLGSNLEEGQEAEKRVETVALDDELSLKVISFEDLIIDRLCAAKFWKDVDSEMWAKVLLEIKNKTGRIDMLYLNKRAVKEKVVNYLKKILPK
ncbi:MAG: hypothetical protein AB1632_12800 [Nitrospirota bacterium]